MQPLFGSKDALFRDVILARPLFVSGERFLDLHIEVVAEDAETSGTGRPYVPGAFLRRGVRIVYDEGLFRLDAGSQEDLLPITALHHVEVYPEVRVEKALAVEGGLSRGLNTYKDNALHAKPFREERPLVHLSG